MTDQLSFHAETFGTISPAFLFNSHVVLSCTTETAKVYPLCRIQMTVKRGFWQYKLWDH